MTKEIIKAVEHLLQQAERALEAIAQACPKEAQELLDGLVYSISTTRSDWVNDRTDEINGVTGASEYDV